VPPGERRRALDAMERALAAPARSARVSALLDASVAELEAGAFDGLTGGAGAGAGGGAARTAPAAAPSAEASPPEAVALLPAHGATDGDDIGATAMARAPAEAEAAAEAAVRAVLAVHAAALPAEARRGLLRLCAAALNMPLPEMVERATREAALAYGSPGAAAGVPGRAAHRA